MNSILHITDIGNAKGNGVAHAVSEYIKYESKECTTAILNLNDNVTCDGIKSYNRKKYCKISDLDAPFQKPDLVVFNEVYKIPYLRLYKECVKNGIPYVIIPHGCLVAKSQNEKKLKKIIGNVLAFNRFIRKAEAIQFLNNNEKENSRFKYKKAIISGNGVDLTSVGENKSTNKSLVYIGRYAPYIKGLDLIVDICSKHKDWFIQNGVDIQLYGRNSVNGLEELEKMIDEKDVSEIVKINDAIYGTDKKRVLENAYAFIQTSRHEGQPMGIIEALAYGLPCIVTEGTSFGDIVNENKCGFGCEFDSEMVFEAIKKIILDSSLRNDFSKNATSLARKDYDWNCIIHKLLEEYEGL